MADTYTVIMEGNVVMSDGSVPPKTVGIERECTDIQGSAPGPITDKKGHWLWQQQLDPMLSRVCFLEAHLTGFQSSRVDMSNMNLSTFVGSKIVKMPDLVLSPRDNGISGDMNFIADSDVPGKAQKAWKAAIKAVSENNMDGGIQQLQLCVQEVPKFADGWNLLGSAYERVQKYMEAREALEKAIAVNPKLSSPYLRLARVDNRLGDFDAAAKAEASFDSKPDRRYYPEIYLQEAITKFQQKDLAGAEESAKNALMSPDPKHHLARAEYVLARIMLAKGDTAGAKEHMETYLKLDPIAADAPKIQAELLTLGTPQAKDFGIALERP